MAEERNEQSVLISLDTLTAASKDIQSPKEGAAVGEQSGLIDIGALESAGLLDDVAAAAAPAPAAAVAPSAAGVVRVRRRGVGLVAGVVFGLIAAVGLAVFVTMQVMKGEGTGEGAAAAGAEAAGAGEVAKGAASGAAAAGPAEGVEKAAAAKAVDAGATAAAKQPDAAKAADGEKTAEGEKEAKEEAVAAAKEAKKPSKRSRRRSSRQTSKGKASKPEPAAAESAPAPAVAAAAPKPAAPEKKATSEVDDLLSGLKSGKPAGGAGPSPAAAAPADPSLPEQLSRNQIMSVVRKSAASMRGCKSEAGGQGGVVAVKLSIAGSGTVNSANVVRGAEKGSPLANCVERKAKVFRFPQFGGKAMTVTLPFSI